MNEEFEYNLSLLKHGGGVVGTVESKQLINMKLAGPTPELISYVCVVNILAWSDHLIT